MPLRLPRAWERARSTHIVQHELRRIIEGTLMKCEGLESRVVDALRRRWELVLSATEEESRVCERAARLGLDAHDEGEVNDMLAALLARHDVAAIDPVFDDLLDAADAPDAAKLEEQVETLGELLVEAENRHKPVERFAKARARLAGVQGRPYEGVTSARASCAKTCSVCPTSRCAGARSSDRGDPFATPRTSGSPRRRSSSAAFRHSPPLRRGRPSWLPARSIPSGGRFVRARAIGALVASETPRLVTASFDPDQQASRAFAAELLAPASLLASRLVAHRR